MKFSEHIDPTINRIRNYGSGSVQVNQTPYTRSCVISQTQLITDWPVHDIDQLDTDQLQTLLDLKPEVLLLGSGEQQRFPHPKLFQYAAQRGISLEVMDNAAACRTYNVLTTENRQVIVALILPASD